MKIKYSLFPLAIILSTGAQAAEPDFSWFIESGLGYESNVYHAPDHDYIDFYQATNPLVQPEEKGGAFIPMKLGAEMSSALTKRTRLLAEYQFDTHFYLGSEVNDANYTDHDVALGVSRALGDPIAESAVYGGLFVSTHNQVYVDRDTGEPKDASTGADVSDRYSYKSYGVEGDYERRIGAGQLDLGLKYASMDYDDPGAWSEYDHSYTRLKMQYDHDVSDTTRLGLGFSHSIRDYSARHAFSSDGRLLASNPVLTYTYQSVDVGLRQRLAKRSLFYADYKISTRRDNHVGYNDKNGSHLKLRLSHGLSRQLKLRAKLALHDWEYPNAYNFEDPTQGKKSASGTDVELKAEYDANRNKMYFVSVEHVVRDHSDDRYAYSDLIVLLGARWEY